MTFNPKDPSFKRLQSEWYAKLKKSGFNDVEDSKERLKAEKNRRSISFDNRDRILNFYLHLDSYLTNTKDIPDKHRKILELYSQGKHVEGPQGIYKQVKLSERTVYRVIQTYREIVLDIIAREPDEIDEDCQD